MPLFPYNDLLEHDFYLVILGWLLTAFLLLEGTCWQPKFGRPFVICSRLLYQSL